MGCNYRRVFSVSVRWFFVYNLLTIALHVISFQLLPPPPHTPPSPVSASMPSTTPTSSATHRGPHSSCLGIIANDTAKSVGRCVLDAASNHLPRPTWSLCHHSSCAAKWCWRWWCCWWWCWWWYCCVVATIAATMMVALKWSWRFTSEHLKNNHLFFIVFIYLDKLSCSLWTSEGQTYIIHP